MNDDGLDRDRWDWARLAELREVFLGRAGPSRDYWRSRDDLALYDATFGARIGWKWAAVLDELAERGVEPPRGEVLDWGAGGGVASRAWLERFGVGAVERWTLVDRSPLAREHAAASLGDRLGDRPIELASDAEGRSPAVLLVSHVLTELADAAREALVLLARRSSLVVWVEPGAHGPSRALGAIRDRLLDVHDPIAPCTHAARCPALASGRERDWCHFFAPPPPEAFTERGWTLFGKRMGIDLRSLPYAFIAMAARGRSSSTARAGLARVLGRPRVDKAVLRLEACSAEGLREIALRKRDDPPRFRAWQRIAELPRTIRADPDALGRFG